MPNCGRSRSTPDFLADALSRPHNTGIRIAVKTAREWKLPPRQILYGEPKLWNQIDTKLSMGLTLLEGETCNDCGTVSWLGHSADNRIVFKHKTTYCYGCAEMERKRAEESKGKKRDDYGVKPYVQADTFDGQTPLPSRAEEYERRAAKAGRK